jgi:mono/diheme cytochrome c family protein
LGWLSCAAITGCNTRPNSAFVYSDKVAELPEKAQNELKEYLVAFYGTASSPRRMLPTEVEESAEEAATEGADEQMIPREDAVDRDRLRQGQRVYEKNCLPCHGASGDGKGTAAHYLNPKPRDYRRGIFKFTSTPRGYKPRRTDLERTIRYGAKGTSMPAFRWLRDEELQPLIDYVILLSQRGELEEDLLYYAETELELEDDPETKDVEEDSFYKDDVAEMVVALNEEWTTAADQMVLPLTRRPEYSDDSILLGRKAFLERGCAKCHGNDGRGYTQENVGKDDWGNIAYAADLTSGMLHGGRRPIDVYRRIYSGINGTPMPAFGDALAEEPDTIWHLVHYILSIVEGREVPGIEDIQPPPPAIAEPAAGATPATAEPAGDDAVEVDEQMTAEEPAAEEPAAESGEAPDQGTADESSPGDLSAAEASQD